MSGLSLFLSRMGRVIGIVAVVLTLVVLPAMAQQRAPDGAPDPDGSAVHEHTLLQQVPRITGRIDIPDTRAAVLIQPAGRQWDYFHEVLLHWFGAIVIIGMIAALTLVYL